jgi:hypothetical protein
VAPRDSEKIAASLGPTDGKAVSHTRIALGMQTAILPKSCPP